MVRARLGVEPAVIYDLADTLHKGLLPKLSGDVNDVLRGDGTWGDVAAEGSIDWGDIGGDIADQTDLQTALDGKADAFTQFFYTADPDTGFDNSSANTIDIVTGGGIRFRITTASTLTTGPVSSGSNGTNITIQGGQAGTSGGLINGKTIIKGGQGATESQGGDVEIFGGDGTGTATSNPPGGAVRIKAGAGLVGANGADVFISGGNPGSSGTTTGAVIISGGTPTASHGGDVTLTGTAGVGTNKNGGHVKLTPGAATGSGQPGYVNLQASGSELSTSAIGGFTLMPTCNGTPSGTPGSIPTGVAPIVIDRANNLFYIYTNGAWRAPQGSLTLIENSPIYLDSSLSADGKYSGQAITGTLGESVAFGEIIYLKAADSKWWKARANAEATSGPVMVGVCVVAGSADATTTILLDGFVRADTLYPSMTVGAVVYISDATAGQITQTAPTTTDYVTRAMGHAFTADILHFKPAAVWLTHT